jgi:hypothetical protein
MHSTLVGIVDLLEKRAYPPVVVQQHDAKCETVRVPETMFHKTTHGLALHWNDSGFMKKALFKAIIVDHIAKNVPGGLERENSNDPTSPYKKNQVLILIDYCASHGLDQADRKELRDMGIDVFAFPHNTSQCVIVHVNARVLRTPRLRLVVRVLRTLERTLSSAHINARRTHPN